MDYSYEIVERLPDTVYGKGDNKGHVFHKVHETDLPDGRKAYIFKQDIPTEGERYYEVIFPKIRKKILRWEGTMPVYSDTEWCEYYPNISAWGSIAWTCRGLKRAMDKFEKELNELLKA